MSITSEQYVKWCDAVSNTNRAALEIREHRDKNYKWMGTILREFFEQFGEVVNVHLERDASEITVRMTGDIKLDASLMASLPFTFTIQESIGDILFSLKPDVLSEEDLIEGV